MNTPSTFIQFSKPDYPFNKMRVYRQFGNEQEVRNFLARNFVGLNYVAHADWTDAHLAKYPGEFSIPR